jgi:LPXTG-motif cell wall-anchored protein
MRSDTGVAVTLVMPGAPAAPPAAATPSPVAGTPSPAATPENKVGPSPVTSAPSPQAPPTPAVAAPPPFRPSLSHLPHTGLSLFSLLLVAIALIALGTVLVRSRSPRRSA